MRIIQTIREAGRALVIAFNKWDLVDEERRYYLDREIERDLVQVQWAPRINVTARTGWHVDRLVPALDEGARGLGDPDHAPAQLNAFLGRLVAEHPHPVRSGKQPQDPVRHPGRRPRRRRSCCSPAASWTRATSASSSVACARSSASSAPRSRSAVAPAREAQAVVGVRRLVSGAFVAVLVGCRRALVGRAAGYVGAVAPRPVAGTVVPGVPGRQLVEGGRLQAAGGRPQRTPWLSHMYTERDLHPDFGPSYGDGPDYGIPVTVVGGAHRKVRGDASTTASESDRERYPLGADTRIEGGRGSAGDKHAIVVDKGDCKLYETWLTRVRDGRWRAGSGATWKLSSNRLRPERLDLRRRRRAADPARPAALERGQGRQGQPRDPVHHRRHRGGPPVARPARRRLRVGDPPPADGGALPAAIVVRRERAGRPCPGGRQGDEDLRAGARRQRLAVVLPGRAQRATGRTA